MVARGLAVALAAGCIAVAVHALHADHGCAVAKADASTAARGELGAVASTVAQRCGDPRDAARVTLVLFARGDRPAAVDLARRMTRSSPDDYLGWLVTWRLTGERGALARAHALNPRGAPAS